VKLAKNADEAHDLAKQILGMTLITHQTGPEGRVVHKVLIEEALNIDRELYLGITLDRRIGLPVVMASQQGGMEIRGGRRARSEGDSPRADRLCPRRPGLPGPRGRERPRPHGRSLQEVRRFRAEADARLHRDRRVTRRNQPAPPDERGNVLALDCR